MYYHLEKRVNYVHAYFSEQKLHYRGVADVPFTGHLLSIHFPSVITVIVREN